MGKDTSEKMTFCCSTLSDFFHYIFEFQKTDVRNGTKLHDDYSKRLWYRGHSKENYLLWPTLFRELYKKNKTFFPKNEPDFYEILEKTENAYLAAFKTKRGHVLEKTPEYDLEWLAVMQHYGTPTRLLDWTENALTACFFALYDYWTNEIDKNTAFPCVWILKPEVLNVLHQGKGTLFNFENYKRMIIRSYEKEDSLEIDQFIRKNWKPKTRILPLSILVPYNSPRILAQSGGFTLFANPPQKADEISGKGLALEEYVNANLFLRKIIFTKPHEMVQELRAMGIKHFNFFPELDKGAIDINEEVLSLNEKITI